MMATHNLNGKGYCPLKALLHPCLCALRNGRPVVIATILERSGSAPRGAGAAMLVYEDGRAAGTVGGGAVERRVWERAMDCFAQRRSSTARYRLSPNEVEDIGMVCGGDVTVLCWYLSPADRQALSVFSRLSELSASGTDAWLVRRIEAGGGVPDAGVCCEGKLSSARCITYAEAEPLLSRQPMLTDGPSRLFVEPVLRAGHAYVFGGGHIAQELVPLLNRLDFSPIVFDDRADFVSKALFPDAARVILGDFRAVSSYAAIRPADYVVIMTRGHRYDHELLTQVLRTDAAYIGLIGSRSKIAHTKSLLFQEGFTEADFARVHTPVGLPIHAETPPEIAVSIAAEMILKRNEPSTTGKAD